MEPLADDVFRISLMPRDSMNAYLLGDVVVDAGVPGSAKKVVAAVRDRGVREHAITHAHPDHAGGSRRVLEALDLDGVACGERDAEAVENGEIVLKKATDNPIGRFLGSFDGNPVSRRLREGDEIGPGFVVIDVPGHSPGHVAFWRERDRLLIAGDVFFNLNPLTLRVGLRMPFDLFTPDVEENKRSAKKLAALEPAIVGFGHGPLVRDAAPKLQAVAAKL